MLSQQQIKENNFKLRIERFEKLWIEAEGSDFDKALTMLHAYCAYSNWGTHADAVWFGIRDYYGTTGSRTKNKTALRYTLPYLFLQISENLSYAKIKPHGDLAAIFAVIQAHTQINPYDFDQTTQLYKAYAPYKIDIRKISGQVYSWRRLIDCLLGITFISAPKLLDAVFKAKLIDYVDLWELAVEKYADDKAYVRYSLTFGGYFQVTDEDLRKLFNSSKAQSQCHFMQYMYCRYYKFNIHDYYCIHSTGSVAELIRVLCILSGDQPVDGILLLDLIKKIPLDNGNKIMESFYGMFISLIEKRHLMANWNEIEEILINIKCIDFAKLVAVAIHDNSLNAINYLLKEKKIKIDLKSHRGGCGMSKIWNPSRCAIVAAIEKISTYENLERLQRFHDLIKMLVEYDSDCVKIRKFAFDEMRARYKDSKNEKEATRILDEIHNILYRASYCKQSFTFFSGNYDGKSIMVSLPAEVVSIIAENILNDITIKKS